MSFDVPEHVRPIRARVRAFIEERVYPVEHVLDRGDAESRSTMQRLMGEAAFRHEALAFGVALVLFTLVGAALVEYVALFVLAMVLFAFEALNTAIEELVDRVSPEISSVGKHAKDLGSFACFCLIVANGALVAYVVLGRLLFWH